MAGRGCAIRDTAGLRAAERRRTGRARRPVLPDGRRSCPARCGSRPRPSPRGGCGCAPRCGWCCPTTTPARRLAEVLSGPSLTVECSPDFIDDAWRKLLTNAVAGPDGADRSARRACSAATTSPRSAAPTSPNASPWRGPRAPHLDDDVIEETIAAVHRRARGSDDLDPDRPRAGQAAGMGRPQRRRRAQGAPSTAWPRPSATWWCRCSRRRATDPGDPPSRHTRHRVSTHGQDLPVRTRRPRLHRQRPVPIRQHRRPHDHPEQLFEVLGDAESWPHWATVITNVDVDQSEPRGVGTTRTVDMRGDITGARGVPRLGALLPHGLSLQREHVQRHLRLRRGLPGGANAGRTATSPG